MIETGRKNELDGRFKLEYLIGARFYIGSVVSIAKLLVIQAAVVARCARIQNLADQYMDEEREIERARKSRYRSYWRVRRRPKHFASVALHGCGASEVM